MSKGLELFNTYILSRLKNTDLCFLDVRNAVQIVKQELKDYQEIKEIAKRYNWNDITSEIFNVKTDKKYRDLFNSAIVNIQEDYHKARVLEAIKDFVWIENGEIHLGLYGDSEIVLRENDFESKEKYNLLKEELL